MLKHIRWDEIETEQLNPKLKRQFFTSGGVTMARLTMGAGLVIPTHHHGSEQITSVVQGSIKMWLEGKEYLLRAGDVLCIPANLPHTTEVLENTVCLDVFSPPRTDWLAGEDSYLRGTGFGASSAPE
jgi:quercetin dioxygenase-like cupin family protein